MYGYRPPEQDPTGTWAEALMMINVVFLALAPVLGILAGAMLLLALTLVLFFQHPALALLPLSVIGLGVYLLARRDRKLHEEEEHRLLGPR
ncbi:MAG: hypothetical protein FJZ92_05380 [Chloroflexi bacterium]|nr:hypothetical protein [Chloroflexota bacterium]